MERHYELAHAKLRQPRDKRKRIAGSYDSVFDSGVSGCNGEILLEDRNQEMVRMG